MYREQIKVLDCTIRDGIESDMKISVMVDSYRVKEQHFAPAIAASNY